jgi:hypothetical protein
MKLRPMARSSQNCHPERSEGSASLKRRRFSTIGFMRGLAHSVNLRPKKEYTTDTKLFAIASAAITVVCAFFPVQAQACSMAPRPGYFHQVTSIRGRVVGRSLGPLQFRWLRQSFTVSDATLTLYEYPWSAGTQDLKRITQVKTSSRGAFDFGFVPEGHYSLGVSVSGSDSLGGWFPVEITNKVGRTEEILLDVSPIHPDCTGGHEFVEKKIKNAASK